MEFFGDPYPRNDERRNAILEAVPGFPDNDADSVNMFAERSDHNDEAILKAIHSSPHSDRSVWDPFTELDDQFYDTLSMQDHSFNEAANKFVERFA